MIRIPSSDQFSDALENRRPKGTPRASTKAVAGAAREFAVLAAPLLEEVFEAGVADDEPAYSDSDTVRFLALDLALMAEDLLSGGFLWGVIEEHNRRVFGTPLPLVVKAGDAALPAPDVLDERRFRFFLHTVWPCMFPQWHAFPDDETLVDLAGLAARFFERLRGKAVSAREFILAGGSASDEVDGAGVKQRLLWLGCASYLLRPAHGEHVLRHPEENESYEGRIAITDDFLCEQCTQWSGLGALEICADAMQLGAEDRADVLSWSERHMAMYRVESVSAGEHPKAPGEPMVLLGLTNIVNGRRYEVVMFMEAEKCPFKAGMLLMGALSRWRGMWRWMGTQEVLSEKTDTAEFSKNFRRKCPHLAYRMCPDLLAIAREAEARQQADFLRFHGGELKVQPDGLAMAAAEQRRLREALVARAAETGADAAEVLRKHGIAGDTPAMNFPEQLVSDKKPMAVFYAAGSGMEIMQNFDVLRAALRARSFAAMSDDEREVLEDFVEGQSISPEFVRRVTREWGSDGIVAYYCGEAEAFAGEQREAAVEYLIRRFKGAAFRGRYPCMSVAE